MNLGAAACFPRAAPQSQKAQIHAGMASLQGLRPVPRRQTIHTASFWVILAAKEHIDSIPMWHDRTGFSILLVSFIVLWGIAHLVSGHLSKAATVKNKESGGELKLRTIIQSQGYF